VSFYLCHWISKIWEGQKDALTRKPGNLPKHKIKPNSCMKMVEIIGRGAPIEGNFDTRVYLIFSLSPALIKKRVNS